MTKEQDMPHNVSAAQQDFNELTVPEFVQPQSAGPEAPAQAARRSRRQERAPRVRAERQPGRLRGRAKLAGRVMMAGLAVAGAAQVWDFITADGDVHSFESEILPKETMVFEDVSLNLARIESTFHIKQETKLDRGEDSLIDWNPTFFNTELDQDITTISSSGVTVERLEAELDPNSKTMNVVIDGGIRSTLPAIDWDENELKVEMTSKSIGIGSGELDKAKHSALQLIQRAGEISTACALRDNEVQDLFGEGVVRFLKSTSFADGVEPENITVTIRGLDESADEAYDEAIVRYDDTKDKISDRYNGKENTFTIKDSNLVNCDNHNIVIAKPGTSEEEVDED